MAPEGVAVLTFALRACFALAIGLLSVQVTVVGFVYVAFTGGPHTPLGWALLPLLPVSAGAYAVARRRGWFEE